MRCKQQHPKISSHNRLSCIVFWLPWLTFWKIWLTLGIGLIFLHVIKLSVSPPWSSDSVFWCNLYLQIFKVTSFAKTQILGRLWAVNMSLIFAWQIILHKKLCKKRTQSTYCLPDGPVASIKISSQTPVLTFFHNSQPFFWLLPLLHCHSHSGLTSN